MTNAYLLIKGLPGTMKNKKEGIEITSFSFGVSSAQAGAQMSGETRAGRPHFQDFNVTKYVDPTSPTLFINGPNNQHFDEAVVGFMKQIGAGSENEEYLRLTFTKVFITSYQIGAGGESNPTEQISFTFDKVKYEYNPEKSDGKGLQGFKAVTYDIKENKKV